jgi:hypothetical protein
LSQSSCPKIGRVGGLRAEAAHATCANTENRLLRENSDSGQIE